MKMKQKFLALSLFGLLSYGQNPSIIKHLHTGTEALANIAKEFSVYQIPVKQYTLDNGLKVIIHEDHSDPIVYVDVTYHVGSAREQVGRSGFAHFFEHMMFQGSKHVADDEHFKIVTEAGGTMNGSTNTDRTNYFQLVPSNQLEVMLWLEADRMGFLLDSVTQQKFEIQRETVKNERGQRYDNAPYGLVFEKIGEALYPPGHPYSWSTIGYIEDLNRVDVNDLKRFYLRWYGPNNAVLTIAGDVNPEKTLELVKKYFGSIPRGPEVKNMAPVPSNLPEKRYISYEDNIKLPQLNLAFPAVAAFEKESYALDALCYILSGKDDSPMHTRFIKSGKAISANIFNYKRELDGYLHVTIRAVPGTSLSIIEKDFYDCLNNWEQSGGATENDLKEYKNIFKSQTIGRLSTVMNKGQTLAHYATLTGDPQFLVKEAFMIHSLTVKDIMDVYNKYLKNKPCVVLSTVPKGSTGLIAAPDNWKMPPRKIENESEEYKNLTYRPVKENFDRSKKPIPAPPKTVTIPNIYTHSFKNGIVLNGIVFNEVPKVSMNISIPRGINDEDPSQAGIMKLLSAMMNKSTKKHKTGEIQSILNQMGSRIVVYSDNQKTVIYLECLEENWEATLSILKEILFEPAFDPEEFKEVKKRHLESITNNLNNASMLADIFSDKVLYESGTRSSLPENGTRKTVNSITLEQVQKEYEKLMKTKGMKISVCSGFSKDKIVSDISFLEKISPDIEASNSVSAFKTFQTPEIYFYDKKNAAQTEIRVVHPAIPRDATGEFFKSNASFYPVGIAFNSRLNYFFREQKGWTYGARGGFRGNKNQGYFIYSGGFKWSASDSVIREFQRITKETLEKGLQDKELNFLRSAIIQSEALKYESPSQKLEFIDFITEYNLKPDYTKKQAEILTKLSKEECLLLLKKNMPLEKLQYIVVGDASKILDKIKSLGIKVNVITEEDEVLQ